VDLYNEETGENGETGEDDKADDRTTNGPRTF
jgi:hypothetical protein